MYVQYIYVYIHVNKYRCTSYLRIGQVLKWQSVYVSTIPTNSSIDPPIASTHTLLACTCTYIRP